MDRTLATIGFGSGGRRARLLGAAAGIGLVALGGIGPAFAAQPDIVIPGSKTFPESITNTSDGTVIIGSLGEGGIFRVRPGSGNPEPWIKPGTNGLLSVIGVLADERSNTLWACSSDLSALGVTLTTGQKPTALKSFDLKTGEPKGSVPLPGTNPLCNDIAIGPDGAAYVTDSFNPQVLRLKPGAKEFEVWAQDQQFAGKGPQLDGLAFGADGHLYVNTFEGAGLYRIEVQSGGKAGKVTKLQPSQTLDHPDGMRPSGNKLLMAEGGGRLDLVTIEGDTAKVQVLKDGIMGPVAVTQVGDTALVLEGKLGYLFDEKLKGKDPAPFKAYAVPMPK